MTWKRGAAIAGVIAIVVAIVLSPARHWVTTFVDWVHDHGPSAAVLYVVVYVVAAMLMVPGSGLTVGAGFVYGVLWGTLLVIPASIAAALLSFAIARRFGREWIARRTRGNRKFEALDRAIGRTGFKITLLARLSPIFPYGLLNYALGITDVKFRDYALATAIGMLPGTILYVYLGSLVTTASDVGRRPAEGWLYWTGGAIAVVVAVAVTWIARRALQRELAEVQS